MPLIRLLVFLQAAQSHCATHNKGRLKIRKDQQRQKKFLYKGEAKEHISDMHWTPDGKFIYIICYWKDREEFREKLIEVSTNKEVPFKKIEHGFYPYTWK